MGIPAQVNQVLQDGLAMLRKVPHRIVADGQHVWWDSQNLGGLLGLNLQDVVRELGADGCARGRKSDLVDTSALLNKPSDRAAAAYLSVVRVRSEDQNPLW
jgi:hypothetical protein